MKSATHSYIHQVNYFQNRHKVLRTIPHSRCYSHLLKQNTQPSSSRDFTVWKMLSQAREERDCHSCQSHFRNVLHALGTLELRELHGLQAICFFGQNAEIATLRSAFLWGASVFVFFSLSFPFSLGCEDCTLQLLHAAVDVSGVQLNYTLLFVYGIFASIPCEEFGVKKRTVFLIGMSRSSTQFSQHAPLSTRDSVRR